MFSYAWINFGWILEVGTKCMNENKVVFKRSLKGILLFIIGILVFVIAGIWMMSFEDMFYRIIGIVSIIFFGFGGLCAIFLGSLWQPIAVVSSEGIASYLRRGKQFVAWSNVKSVRVVTQEVSHGHKEKYIGVFAIDDTLVEGTGGAVAKYIGKAITRWDEMPVLLISPNFSNVTHNEILEVILKFHKAYQERETWMYENHTTK